MVVTLCDDKRTGDIATLCRTSTALKRGSPAEVPEYRQGRMEESRKSPCHQLDSRASLILDAGPFASVCVTIRTIDPWKIPA
jgi:hypothetical protein